MASHLIYVNPAGQTLTVESTIVGTDHTFVLNETSFVVGLLKDGKYHNSSLLTPKEQYYITGAPSSFEPQRNDFSAAGRTITIGEAFFFLVSDGGDGVPADFTFHTDDLDIHVTTDDKNRWDLIYSFVPFIDTISPLFVSKQSTQTVTITGAFFTANTTVTVGALQVNNLKVKPNSIKFDLVTDNVDATYDITITNDAGPTIHNVQMTVGNDVVLIPTAPDWTTVQGNISYFAGVVEPSDLNTQHRIAIWRAPIAAQRDFTLAFNIDYNLIAGGANTDDSYIGIYSGNVDPSPAMPDQYMDLFVRKTYLYGKQQIPESGARFNYASGQYWGSPGTALTSGTWAAQCTITRESGVIIFRKDGIESTYISPTYNNDEISILANITGHNRISGIQLTLTN